jgi:hypothetical protein
MGEYEAGTFRTNGFGQLRFTCFRYLAHGTEMLQQYFRSLFTDPLNLFQAIAECPAASFFPVKGDAKTVHFIAYLPDEQ